ncbi:hypothetical protein WA026_020590 [Henosepilachna vigintioctopunctata]|uniref:MADF domain-containing protein n=1 Tax=Henosepilachna vigintioctopunctata TaxID=420089 RepID=A0AAW1V5I2_9CUCU
MAEQSDKSDSDSRDAQETYLRILERPENSLPERIAANKLLLNDFRQYPELWDVKHEAFGTPPSIHLREMLEKRHNLQQGELDTKWIQIKTSYEELIKMDKLRLSDDEGPSDGNDAIQYPYTNEMRFYKSVAKRSKKAAKPEKRRHSDDEPTHSKRNVQIEPVFDHLGEESSSPSVSLETGPGSHLDTDSQDSSKLSQHETDSRLRFLLVNRDRGTQTSSSSRISEDSDGPIIESLISLHNQLEGAERKEFHKKLAKLVKIYSRRPSSSEDSSAAQ